MLDALRLLLDHPSLSGHQREQVLMRRLHPGHPTIVHTRQSKSPTDTPGPINSDLNAYRRFPSSGSPPRPAARRKSEITNCTASALYSGTNFRRVLRDPASPELVREDVQAGAREVGRQTGAALEPQAAAGQRVLLEPGQCLSHRHYGQLLARVSESRNSSSSSASVGYMANPRPAASLNTYPECIQPRSTDMPYAASSCSNRSYRPPGEVLSSKLGKEFPVGDAPLRVLLQLPDLVGERRLMLASTSAWGTGRPSTKPESSSGCTC